MEQRNVGQELAYFNEQELSQYNAIQVRIVKHMQAAELLPRDDNTALEAYASMYAKRVSEAIHAAQKDEPEHATLTALLLDDDTAAAAEYLYRELLH